MTVADVKVLVEELSDAEIHTIGDPRLQGGEDWEGATRYKLLAALSAALTRLLAGAAPQQKPPRMPTLTPKFFSDTASLGAAPDWVCKVCGHGNRSELTECANAYCPSNSGAAPAPPEPT